MAKNPHFDALLSQMREMHERKNHDYAEDNNPFSNFEFAAEFSKGYTDPVDRVFAVLIGVKTAREIELSKGKTVNNESLADTRLDKAVYQALWTAYHMKKNSIKSGASVESTYHLYVKTEHDDVACGVCGNLPTHEVHWK